MHLRRPLPEQPRRLEVGADGLGRQLGQLAGRGEQQAARKRWRVALRAQLGGLQVTGQGRLRVAPGVALVRDIALQHGHRDGLALVPAVLERARQRRDLREMSALGEETSDLELGIDPILDAPEHLQDQALAEDDRVVALLDR